MNPWFKAGFWFFVVIVVSLATVTLLGYLTELVLTFAAAIGRDINGLEAVLLAILIVLATYLIGIAYLMRRR